MPVASCCDGRAARIKAHVGGNGASSSAFQQRTSTGYNIWTHEDERLISMPEGAGW
jgi:hypothetical protein